MYSEKENRDLSYSETIKDNSEYDPTSILIKFKPNRIDVSNSDKILREIQQVTRGDTSFVNILSAKPIFSELNVNSEKKHQYGLDCWVKITVNKGTDINQEILKWKAIPDVEDAQPNYMMTLYLEPNDPYYHSSGSWGQSYPDLWGIHKINASGSWDISTGSRDVVVAIVDTGVDYTHPDITANMWINEDEIPDNGIDDDHDGFVDNIYGADFSDLDGDPIDYFGHGTHCAGTIAAMGNNGLGVVGVNWQTKIMPVKVFPNALSEVMAAGLCWAVDNGADVISNSWGPRFRRPSAPLLETAVKYAHDAGCVIVFAAGNNDDDVQYYCPANMDEVIAVAATNYLDNKASFSNWGTKITVCAPGVDVLSLRAAGTDMYDDGGAHVVGGNYYRASGTSMACPHVAGLAALIRSLSPNLSNMKVKEIIKSTADDIDMLNPGYEGLLGSGRINANNAAVNISQMTNVLVQSLDIYSHHLQSPETIHVNVTICNDGLNDVTDALVDFRINGASVDSIVIPLLEKLSEKQISFTWTPQDIGIYNVTVNVSITGAIEYYYNDNEKTEMIVVGVQNINTSECFHSIQEAIDDPDTVDGHQIFAPCGIYYENILINKNILLIGMTRETTVIESSESSGKIIQIMNTDSTTVAGFTLKNGTYGLYIEATSNTCITNTSIFGNTEAGIYLSSTENSSIVENQIIGSKRAIIITDHSNVNTINNNNIFNNQLGILIDDGNIGNQIYHNLFDNTQNALDNGTNNIWDNGYNEGVRICGGNWWSDNIVSDEFSGPNQDVPGNDGIDDDPYNISGSDSKDRYPLTELGTELLPATIYVDDDAQSPFDGTVDHPYPTIQDALNNSIQGDTIFVSSGTYISEYENNININCSSLRLIGENKDTTIIRCYRTFYYYGGIIIENANGVMMSGFTIKSDDGPYGCSSGIATYFSDNATIVDCVVKDFSCVGIALWGSWNCTISKNLLTNNGVGCCLFGFLRKSNNNIFSYNNVIDNTHYGVSINISPNFSNDNIFFCNNFINNTQNVYDICTNMWYSAELEKGNYWDDFETNPGYPETYEIPGGNNVDLNPLLNPVVPSDNVTVYTHGPYSGFINERLYFRGSATGGVQLYTWFWDFGDGFNSSSQTPYHIYTQTGTYTVTLTVTDRIETTVLNITTATITIRPLTVLTNGPYSGFIDVPLEFIGYASDGLKPYTYCWDFGDNTSAETQQYCYHGYQKAGIYTVMLSVTDSRGVTAINTTTATITIGPLTAQTNGPYSGFIDVPLEFIGHAIGGLKPYTYCWDFGDGNYSYEQSILYSYQQPGIYTVILTITDAVGTTATTTTWADIAPTLVADAHGPYTGIINQDVHFYGNATGGTSSYSWTWNFGDNTPVSHQQNPYHSYPQPSIYTVTLTVTDSYGTIATNTTTATITAPPLFVNVNGPYTGAVRQPILFTGNATGGIKPYTWYWDFGDNSYSSSQNASYSYAQGGIYTVTLTVLDLQGTIVTNTTWATIIDSIHNINNDTYYLTIQAAINDADPGDTISVRNGTYHENLNIHKPVILIGENKETTIIDGDSSLYQDATITLTDCNDIIIRQFTIKNGLNGIIIYSADDIIISDCIITNNINFGIYIWNADHITIFRNIISDIQGFGYGIILLETINNTLFQNLITRCNYGISLWDGSSQNSIYENTIQDNRITGIKIQHYASLINNNKIYHNIFVNNTQNAYDECNNIWYNATLEEGNFWDDFGSNPGYPDVYMIPGGNNVDLYPLRPQPQIPDLMITSFTVTPSSGTQLNLTVTIKNNGTLDITTPFQVAFYSGVEIWIGTIDVSDLQVGETITITKQWDYVPGMIELDVYIDSTHAVEESDEFNNWAYFIITDPLLHDLIITNVSLKYLDDQVSTSLSPDQDVHRSVQVTATIKNNGAAGITKPFQVSFYGYRGLYDSHTRPILLGTVEISSLSVGESTEATILRRLQPEMQTICVVADSASVIEEFDETNNQATISLPHHILWQSLTQTADVYKILGDQYKVPTTEKVIQIVNDALSAEVYTSPADYLKIMATVASLEYEIGGELKGQIHDDLFAKYQDIVKQLLDHILGGSETSWDDTQMVAEIQLHVCEIVSQIVK
ncbi:MAG: S8 family serine peptidase [Euryarchaeota archaeon]|nr:S8 family serine peptidase [Euryarchaeota archaeon]